MTYLYMYIFVYCNLKCVRNFILVKNHESPLKFKYLNIQIGDFNFNNLNVFIRSQWGKNVQVICHSNNLSIT